MKVQDCFERTKYYKKKIFHTDPNILGAPWRDLESKVRWMNGFTGSLIDILLHELKKLRDR